jgi:hypothetical protein
MSDVEIYKSLFISFAISYLVLLCGIMFLRYYSIWDPSKSMKGGGNVAEAQVDSDHFTIISDDIDVGMFDEV